MIYATSKETDFKKEPIPAGNYIARCYQMIEEGTVTEEYMGEPKTSKKVRIGWELPTKKKVFKEELGLQPLVISAEYTLSMHEKANLRNMLKSWRGKDFTDKEAHSFDISKLLGKPCMLNIIHHEAKNGTVYAKISNVTAMPEGVECPKQINPTFILSYDNWDEEKFNTLPEFIREKMKSSEEYKDLYGQKEKKSFDEINTQVVEDSFNGGIDSLPF